MADVEALELPSFKGRPGWEFTDISGLDLAAFAPAGPAAGEVEPLLAAPAVPAGVSVVALDRDDARVREHLGRIVAEDDVFTRLNAAGWGAGTLVHVPRGTELREPIVLSTLAGAAKTALHRRLLILVEDGADAEVWEQYQSSDPDAETLLTTVVEVVVGQNAHLRFVCGQDLNERSWIFGAQRAEVARDGRLDWAAIGFGSARGRVRMETLLAGEGAEAKVTGAYAPHARQHVDFDTTQEHGAANTISDLAFRGILADRSTAVWRGMIKVDPGAQKTDAFQECRNLLISKRAHADAIPGLEILANDVRCTHAAAIAQIDKDQLFYLRSRGLPAAVATRLVIEGFMAELVERFEAGPIREAIGGALERRLARLLD